MRRDDSTTTRTPKCTNGRIRVPARRGRLALVALVVVLGLGACTSSADALLTAEAGDCLTRPADDSGADMTLADSCDTSDDLHVSEVLARTDGDNQAFCDGYPDSDRIQTSLGDDPITLCSRVHLAEGDCFDQTSGFQIECGDSGGLVLEAIVEDSQDPEDCPEGAGRPRVYEGTNEVYCYSAN